MTEGVSSMQAMPLLSWQTLPEGVLVDVFLFLSPSQRGVARQVCRRWERASGHPAILTQSVLKLVGSFGDLSLRSLLWNERIKHLHVINVDNSQWSMQLCGLGEGGGHHVRQLVLENCSVTFATFIHIVQVFSSLDLLSLNGCNTLFMTGQLTSQDSHLSDLLSSHWSSLGTLEVTNVSYLNDDNFWALFKPTNNETLHSFSLKSIKLAYHLEGLTKGSLLCFSSLHSFIKGRVQCLTRVNFDFSNVSDVMLRDLSETAGLRLSEVSLACCRDVTDRGVIPFVTSQTHLQKLNLAHLNQITSKALIAIEQNCRSLNSLVLTKCSSIIGRKTIPNLITLPLTHLNLSECYRIDSVDLSDLCGVPPGLPDLESLEVENFGLISDSFFPKLCQFSPKLKLISLCSVPDISRESMICIFSNLTELRHLKLSWIHSLTDDHLLGIPTGNEASSARWKPRSSGDSKVDGENADMTKKLFCDCDFTLGIAHQKEHSKCPLYTTRNLSLLRKLESLDLSSCSNISDLSLLHAFNLPNLHTLNLSMCIHVTDVSLELICLNCKSLEKLNLGYTAVADSGIKFVSKRLTVLRSLILTNCMAITDAAIGYLEAYAFQLTELDVSLCPNVTQEQINHFQRSVPTVHSIKSRYISSGNFREKY